MEPTLTTPLFEEQRRLAFVKAAANGEELFCVPGLLPGTRSEFVCVGCGRCVADDHVAFQSAPAPTVSEGEALPLHCPPCRRAHLGPPCRACGLPAPRSKSVLAGDSWWHRGCLKCSHPGCSLPLGQMYYEHKGKPFCAEHHTLLTAASCAQCDGPVGRGVSALGRSWHHECFTCSVSGVPLGPTAFFLHEGWPIAPAEREKLAPRCAECGETAHSDRLWAMGRRDAQPRRWIKSQYNKDGARVFHHRQCFVCVHCKVQIGDRRFVALEGEPYLEGCYHKLFGGSAPPDLQAAVGGVRRRYAIAVPLSLPSIGGEQALPAFRASHHRLLGSARRELRERGVVDVHAFFSMALAGMPMLLLGLAFRDDADAQSELQAALEQSRPCVEWSQHIAAAHDPARARGQPWWAAITPEQQSEEGERPSAGE